MTKRRDSTFQTRVDSELLDQAREYADDKGVSLGAIVRALFRLLANDPPEPIETWLPLDQETERAPRRPTRKRRKKSDD